MKHNLIFCRRGWVFGRTSFNSCPVNDFESLLFNKIQFNYTVLLSFLQQMSQNKCTESQSEHLVSKPKVTGKETSLKLEEETRGDSSTSGRSRERVRERESL